MMRQATLPFLPSPSSFVAMASHTYRKADAIYHRLAQLREELNGLYRSRQSERPIVDCPHRAWELLAPFLECLDHEEFWVMCLDTRNRGLGIHPLYRGAIDVVPNIRVAEVFRLALLVNARSIVVAHNHPSGDPSPSDNDIKITRKLAEAGELLDVPLLDHLIIGQPGRYQSLKEMDIL